MYSVNILRDVKVYWWPNLLSYADQMLEMALLVYEITSYSPKTRSEKISQRYFVRERGGT